MSLLDFRISLQALIKNGTLVLNKHSTAGSNFASLLNSIDPDGSLTLNGVTLSSTDTTFTLTGEGNFWKVTEADIRIEFSEQNGTLQAAIQAVPPLSWTLQASFPQLPVTAGLDQSILCTLVIHQARFALSVIAPELGPTLSLSITSTAQSLPDPIKQWLGDTVVEWSGTILAADAPRLELSAKLSNFPGAGPVKLSNACLQFKSSLDSHVSTQSSLSINVAAQLGKDIQLTLADEIDLTLWAPLRLSGTLSPALSLSSLADLLGLIAEDLAKNLDAALPDVGLKLSALRLQMHPTEQTVSLLAFEIDNRDKKWPLGPQANPYLVVNDVLLDLKVYWPLDFAKRRLVAVVKGQSEFLANTVSVQAKFPGPVVSATLTGKPLPILQLLSHNPLLPKDFSLTVPASLEALALQSLTMEMDAAFGSLFFSGEFSLDSKTRLPIAGIKHVIAMNELAIAVRANQNDSMAAMLALKGSTTIADVRSDFNLVYTNGMLQCAMEVQQVKLGTLLEACLDTKINLPELILEKAYFTASGAQASIGGRLSSAAPFPVGHGAVVLQSVWANVDLAAQSISAQLAGEALLGNTHIFIDTTLADSTLILAGSIASLSLPELISDVLNIQDGVPAFEVENIQFNIASTGEAHFSASNVEIDFVSIAAKLGLQLPLGTPNPRLTNFQADFGSSGSCISLTAGNTLSFGGITARDFTFSIEHSQATGLVVSMGFAVHDKITLAKGCELELALMLSGVSNGEFTVQGNATINLFAAKPIQLNAQIERKGETRTLRLDYKGASLPLNNPEDPLALTIKTITLIMTRIMETTNFEFDASCDFAIGKMDNIGVTMFVESKDNIPRLGIKADTTPLKLPSLSLPSFSPTGHVPGIEIHLDELSLSISKSTQEKNQTGFDLFANATLRLTNFAPFDTFIGSELEGGLTASAGTIRIDLKIPAALQAKQWPQLSIKLSDDKIIPIPVPTLLLQTLCLNISPDPTISANWRVTVPPELNKLIGMDLFAEAFELQLDIGKAVRLWPTGKPSWPLRSLQTEKLDDQDWLKFDVLRIEIPTFEFDGANWSVQNLGIRGLRTFGLPLLPLKYLMRLCGAPADVIKCLPDSVSLGGIDLDAGKLDQQIPKILGGAAVSKINALLKPTGKTLEAILAAIFNELEKLPVNFHEYLKLDIPDTAQLDIGVTSTGGCRMSLRVDPAHPLRLLLPYMGLPPGILGITVSEFTIGEGAAGMLMLFGCDGYIDQFDLISLIAAIGSDNGQRLAQRITLSKVFAVAPSVTPIPIPLFFGELALDHVDFLGFELHSRWSFGPEKPLGLIELFELIVALTPFFSQSGYYLHTDGHLPDSLKLPFTIGANNFTLPSYLGGGKPQGLPASLPAYNLTGSIAYLLDACKDLNPAFAIKAIPLWVEENGKRHWIRVNTLDAHVTLGPISLGADAAWCIATEEEFKGPIAQFAVSDGVLTAAALENVFAAIPKGMQVSERGFVIFIMGGWDLKAVAGMQCQFGIAYTRDAGFQTGIRVSATLAETLALSFGGTIQVTGKRLYIEGDTRLSLHTDTKQINLLRSHGEIEIVSAPEKLFRVLVELDIGMMSIGGELCISSTGLILTGKLSWPGFAPAGKASVELRSDGVIACVTGKLAALNVQVSALLPVCTASLIVDIDIGFAQHIQKSIVNEAKNVVNKEIDAVLHQINDAMCNIGNYNGTIGNLRKQALPKICDHINATVTNRMNAIIKVQVEKSTPKFAPNWFKNFIVNKVRAAAKKDAKPYLDAATALRNTANKSQADTANAACALIRQGQKPIYGITPLQGENLNTLNKLVGLIQNVDENQTIQHNGEAAFKKYPLADQIFAKVRASTDQTIDQVIPQIQSLQVTGIELTTALPSTLNAQITFSNVAPIAIELFPQDPVKTSQSIAKAIHKLKG